MLFLIVNFSVGTYCTRKKRVIEYFEVEPDIKQTIIGFFATFEQHNDYEEKM